MWKLFTLSFCVLALCFGCQKSIKRDLVAPENSRKDLTTAGEAQKKSNGSSEKDDTVNGDNYISTEVGGQKESDQFFKIYEGQFLELIVKDQILNVKGCLYVSSESMKCRWRQKGTLNGKPFERDVSGHCRISPTELKNQFQLDIMVWEVNLFDAPGESKLVNVKIDGSDPQLKRFEQTTVFSGGFNFPFQTKIGSVLNTEVSRETLKWVNECKL
jgi:hypothetical protein